MSTPCPFFGEIPSDHRSDWGEALARALGAALDRLRPSGTTGSIARTRGGSLLIVVTSGDGEHQIEIDCLGDAAEVRSEGETKAFGHNWIPELVEHVMQRVSRWHAR